MTSNFADWQYSFCFLFFFLFVLFLEWLLSLNHYLECITTCSLHFGFSCIYTHSINCHFLIHVGFFYFSRYFSALLLACVLVVPTLCAWCFKQMSRKYSGFNTSGSVCLHVVFWLLSANVLHDCFLFFVKCLFVLTPVVCGQLFDADTVNSRFGFNRQIIISKFYISQN